MPDLLSTFRRDARMWVVVGVIVVVWLILAGRLVQLQWLRRTEFEQVANRQQTIVEEIPARPGDVLDRRGRLLATTVTAQSLFVDPARIPDVARFAAELAEPLGLDERQLLQQIAQRADKRFLWVKRRLTERETAAVEALELPRECWGFRPEYLRRYPQGVLAAHVIGLRNIDGVGRGGLEESFDNVLRGESGKRVSIRDARGRVIAIREELSSAPRHGKTLILTLDSVIQSHTERELDAVMEKWRPRSACAIVLDPRNAEILALASRPVFDPNLPGDSPAAAWKNSALAAFHEPGSTFKPFVVAWALQQGLIHRDEVIDCEQGRYRMGRRILHDVHPHGRLSIADILVQSSNIGMAKVGERLTNAGLYQAALEFGFGRRTGIRLPGELNGLLRPLRLWDDYSTGSIPMGQEMACTPLQTITAYAAVANGGKLLNPRLVLAESEFVSAEWITADGSAGEEQVVSETVDAEITRWLRTVPLADVVRHGTARNARLEGFEVFGKTGTAQKIDPETKQYSNHKHVCSFVCGAPAENPRALVLVLVDEPTAGSGHYGGTVAAPAAASILSRTLITLRVPRHDAPLRAADHRFQGTE